MRYALIAMLLICAGCGGPPKLDRELARVVKEPDPVARYVSGTARPVTQPLGAVFGEQLELVGMNAPARVKVGEPFRLETVWRCLRQPDREWVFAIHIDHQNPWWRLNRDHLPPVPTPMWREGQYVSWQIEVAFPEGAPSGKYAIAVYPYAITEGGSRPKAEQLPVTAHEQNQLATIELVAE